MSMLLQLWRLLDTRQRGGFLPANVLALVMVDGLTESEVMETIEGRGASPQGARRRRCRRRRS
jgi:hypothetical protein